MQHSLLIARFPFGGSEHPDTTDWLVQTVLKAKGDPRISAVHHTRVDDTPITMGRNRVLKQALDARIDLVLMIDSDMKPDLKVPGAKPFWDTSLDFLLKHQGPCCIAAPYCGPPPHENVYVFRLASYQSDHPNWDIRLDQYGREDVAHRAGFEEVAALPTGIFLMDMRALKFIQPPWFEYEWADPPFHTKKASTEDVFFTRNLSWAGVPQYVNWDAWAGHHKRKCVGKPSLLTRDAVQKELRAAIIRNHSSQDRLIDVGVGQPQLVVLPSKRIVVDGMPWRAEPVTGGQKITPDAGEGSLKEMLRKSTDEARQKWQKHLDDAMANPLKSAALRCDDEVHGYDDLEANTHHQARG